MAEFLLWIVFMYLGAALLFTSVFVTLGVSRIDSAAKGAPLGFRILLVPGSVALWPILFRTWRIRARQRGRS